MITEPRPPSRIHSWHALSLGVIASVALVSTCHLREASFEHTKAAASAERPPAPRYDALALRGLEAFRVLPGGKAHVVADNTGRFGREWTKCTNLGLDLLTELVAERAGLRSAPRAAQNVEEVLSTLETLRTYHGIFPEFIKLDGVAHAEVKAGTIRYSSIDSAWVTLALSVVEARYRSERSDLAERARQLIQRQDYSALVDSNRLLGGVTIDAVSGAVVDSPRFSYTDRNSEARPLVLALVGLNKLSPAVWDGMSYSWERRAGLPVASGYRASAFVELAGQLFFDEMALAPRSLGLSHENYVKASALLARDKQHVIWGYAPSCAPPDGYAEFGLDRPDVVTPYAAGLLATTRVLVASANLRRLLEALDWSGAPVADALDPTTQRPLCRDARLLDQALLFLALDVEALRTLSRATSWYVSAEARLRAMDRTHPPPATFESRSTGDAFSMGVQ
jgi:hypothetical protein